MLLFTEMLFSVKDLTTRKIASETQKSNIFLIPDLVSHVCSCSLTLCYSDTGQCSWHGFLSRGQAGYVSSKRGQKLMLTSLTHFVRSEVSVHTPSHPKWAWLINLLFRFYAPALTECISQHLVKLEDLCAWHEQKERHHTVSLPCCITVLDRHYSLALGKMSAASHSISGVSCRWYYFLLGIKISPTYCESY